MDSTLVGGLGAVGAVVLIALLLRSANKPEQSRGSIAIEDLLSEGATPPPGREDAGGDDDFDEDDDDEGDVVAVTADNYAVVPRKHAVSLLPPDESGEGWKPGASHARGERAIGMSWHAGDLTGVRVVRGAADEGPWRFEGLGRDGEYMALVFETREGADAALAVFQSVGVVRVGEDDDGNPAPPSAEQFEEARRIYLETEAALGDDEPREGDARRDPFE